VQGAGDVGVSETQSVRALGLCSLLVTSLSLFKKNLHKKLFLF
jgi:hypothetical protein